MEGNGRVLSIAGTPGLMQKASYVLGLIQFFIQARSWAIFFKVILSETEARPWSAEKLLSLQMASIADSRRQALRVAKTCCFIAVLRKSITSQSFLNIRLATATCRTICPAI